MAIDTLTAYHYTTSSAWKRMQTQKRQPGLKPYHQLISPKVRGLSRRAYEKIVFALDAPMPRSWTHNPDRTIWLHLVDYLTDRGEEQVVLLELALPSDMEAFVCDRLPVQQAIDRSCLCSAKELERACRAYWKSRVLYQAYKTNGAGSSICIPELVIWDTIPLDNIRLIWQKPNREFRQEALMASEYKPEGYF